MPEAIAIKRRRGRPRNPPNRRTRRVYFRLRLPDQELLRLYIKLAGYRSINAYAQSVFDNLADQWRNNPEVQELLRQRASQNAQSSAPVYAEVSIDEWLG
ncbi:MAG: hypothetical protein JO333_11625 [Verrucomicrobia bacterium]|nr:hypothetical protein [Verrucomicrobiota bacterium]